MTGKIKTCINSEIGKLEGVIIHKPGSEVENMTPANAERALYSDILNLPIAKREYQQLKGVLNVVSDHVFEIEDLLYDVLKNETVKEVLLKEILINEKIKGIYNELMDISPKVLSKQLLEGIVLEKDNLTKYISQERFLLRPLHNLFFTRDSAMGMNNRMLIGRMANVVRERESIIMEAIFNHHSVFETSTLNPLKPISGIKQDENITLEGGDFQVVRDDVFLIGTGIRTSTQGVDFIIENLKLDKEKSHHIIVQQLPSKPESFIHLDMVFTVLDTDTCMAYQPIIFNMNMYRTIHIKIEGGKVVSIKDEANITAALNKLGIDLKPVTCGGTKDSWTQEREQWHSGANFFSFAPGKIIGYERNINTLEELNKNGFEILKANDIISGKINPFEYKKCVVSIKGSELARGGGGARCMTMPFRRSEIDS